MRPELFVTFNAGSSSLKAGVFTQDGDLKESGRLKIEFNAASPEICGTLDGDDIRMAARDTGSDAIVSAVKQILELTAERMAIAPTAVGHRVVHGGLTFNGPVLLNEGNIDGIEKLVPLAPLHQPQALRVIRTVAAIDPSLPQVASFDTAFHSTQADVVRRFAIPRALHEDGVRRYGFHGLSYKYVARRLAELDAAAGAGRVVAAHLGSGASICAMIGGRSRDTSMGFSALDGIPMATRPGWIDPGALTYLMRQGMRHPDRIEQFLYHECGLLGVSGISGDTRDLLKDPSFEASEAVELFCLRIAGEIARQASTIDGVETVIFTAGIGEHQPEIRGRIAQRLGWLGLELDDGANEANAATVSAARSRIKALVIPTDEELVIAEETISVLSQNKR